jgi:hypothetical protein
MEDPAGNASGSVAYSSAPSVALTDATGPGLIDTGTETPTITDTNPSATDVTAPSSTESIDNVGHFINTEENGGYADQIQNHHLLPRQYGDYFNSKFPAGESIDDYTMNLDANVHRIIHGKGIGYDASWNAQWDAFTGNNPNASTDDIMQFLYGLMYEYRTNMIAKRTFY